MIKILISGALGKMGANVISAISTDPEVTAVCGVDRTEDLSGCIPVYDDFSKVTEQVDVVIDFSSPKALDSILTFISKTGASAVLCSTGYTPVCSVLNYIVVQCLASVCALFYGLHS